MGRLGATVLPGVTIGYGSIVGANSVVTRSVPPFMVVAGNPAKVVKEIKIVAKPAKRGGKNYFVRVELVNGRSADVWCDKEVVELIQTCTELGVESFKSFTLERRTSEKTGAEYIAVVLKMFNDDEYFYFLPRATNTIVELLIAKAAQDETATPAKKG